MSYDDDVILDRLSPNFFMPSPNLLSLGKYLPDGSSTTSWRVVESRIDHLSANQAPLSGKGHSQKKDQYGSFIIPVIFTQLVFFWRASISLNGWGWTLTSTFMTPFGKGTLKLSPPHDSLLYTPPQEDNPPMASWTGQRCPNNDEDNDDKTSILTSWALGVWIHLPYCSFLHCSPPRVFNGFRHPQSLFPPAFKLNHKVRLLSIWMRLWNYLFEITLWKLV